MTETFSPSWVTVEAAASAGVFAPGDLAFAEMLVRRASVADEVAATAFALAAKAVRLDHVCADLSDAGIARLWTTADGEGAVTAPPRSASLLAALAGVGPLVELADEGVDVDPRGDAPLVLSAHRCYLRRYALLEQFVADRLVTATRLEEPVGLEAVLTAVAGDADEGQLDAVRRALRGPVSVIAGGPGTGKTTTVALVLAVAARLPEPLSVALAAPTGKAAARLDEAVRRAIPDAGGEAPAARTLHALVGVGRDGIARREGPLDADVIVVDEASMVSLPLLAATLRRARPGARVILVGDPDQLASIEVGAVLADVVEAGSTPSSGVVISTLATSHRFERDRGVPALAAAVRSGSLPELTAAIAAHDDLACVDPDRGVAGLVSRVADHGIGLIAAARAGDRARALSLVGQLGVLCATRRGPGSIAWWNAAIEAELVARGRLRRRDVEYLGRPLLVTRNDPLTGLMNGMVGVIVADGDERRAVFEVGAFETRAVPWVETVWALTIHKSQGSEYDDVIVSLPHRDSRILTRELLYTAVTRARRSVTLVAPDGSLEAALSHRVARSSGLAARLSRPRRDVP